jgi:hypothetical protein
MLPPMYHWSPRSRRGAILGRGLVPNRRFTMSALDPKNLAKECKECGSPGWVDEVCLAPSPQVAWQLSGALKIHGPGDELVWDLWQVALAGDDEVHVLANWGPYVAEVRVRNRIPKSRVWLVGERTAVVGRRERVPPPIRWPVLDKHGEDSSDL